MKFRTSYDRKQFDGLDFSKDPGRTQQQFKDECDLGSIIARYRETGAIDPSLIRNEEPIYGDFTTVGSYKDSFAVVQRANQFFEGLDADVRARFNNNVAELLDFCNSPENRAEAEQMGLLPKSKEVASHAVPSPVGEGVKSQGVTVDIQPTTPKGVVSPEGVRSASSESA